MVAVVSSLLFKEECYAIIGACMKVHSKLGSGFLEAVYQEALAIEFEKEEILYTREKGLSIYYDGVPLNKKYTADFVCYGKIILETKAARSLTEIDEAQTITYLKATNLRLGLLVNFGQSSLQYKRMIL